MDIQTQRHSLAHIMASAVQKLFQDNGFVRFGVGPVIDNGFYYDIETKERLSKWNEFSNRMTISMVKKHVATVKYGKNRILLNYIIPAGLSALGIFLIAISVMRRKKR